MRLRRRSIDGDHSPAGGAYEIWVGNQATDEVLVFDGKTLSPVATIPVDTDNTPATSAPHLITFTPDHRFAMVACSSSTWPPIG